MTPDLERAITEFADSNDIVMLIADPRHDDALEAASFLWGSAADEFLNAETIKAVSTKELDKVFVIVGVPFDRMLMTKSGRLEESRDFLASLVEWHESRKMSPAVLALTHDESLRTAVSNIIATSEQADRWAKFRI